MSEEQQQLDLGDAVKEEEQNPPRVIRRIPTEEGKPKLYEVLVKGTKVGWLEMRVGKRGEYVSAFLGSGFKNRLGTFSVKAEAPQEALGAGALAIVEANQAKVASAAAPLPEGVKSQSAVRKFPGWTGRQLTSGELVAVHAESGTQTKAVASWGAMMAEIAREKMERGL